MNTKTWWTTSPTRTSRIHALALALVILSLAGAGPATAQDREFTPVTDAMLADPDPADWINWRRTLDGWGFPSECAVNTDPRVTYEFSPQLFPSLHPPF